MLPASVHNGRGQVLQTQGRHAEAIAEFKKAIALTPNDWGAYNNIAGSLKTLHRYADALTYYMRALRLEPTSPAILHNLASLLGTVDRNEEALLIIRKCLRHHPGALQLLASLVPILKAQCAWHDLESAEQLLIELTEHQLNNRMLPTAAAFTFHTLSISRELKLRIAKATAAKYKMAAHLMPGLSISFEHRGKGERLRVGYLSPDFRAHSAGGAFLSLMKEHTHERFEFFAYGTTPVTGDYVTGELVEHFDHFWDVSEASFMDVARLISNDGINILVDLAGHTGGATLEVLALRPAPVQCHYLGYSDTTGADYIDYLITDWEQFPEGEEHYATERLVRLPQSFMPASIGTPSPECTSRGDHSLPKSGFVFANFAGSNKHHPTMFRVWANILRRVPHSVLWLLKSNALQEPNIRAFFGELGVAPPGRIVFASIAAHGKHLERMNHVDLALDTLPHSGGVTTVDALSMGVPILTMRGDTPQGRNGASILMGLPNYVANTLNEYEEKAVNIALRGRPKRIEAKNLPVFNTKRLARHIEWAYERMWEMRETPQRIDVPDLGGG